MECLICKKEVSGSGVKYCSNECKQEGLILKNKNKFLKSAVSLTGIENIDYVTCKWCNCKVKRIYGTHIKNHHPDKTINDYKKEFPDSLTSCISDKKATSVNSGKHMQTDEMRKKMSDKVKGNKNPNHKSKTTEKERKERSPFSDEFYKSRGLDINKKMHKFYK